MHCSVPPPAPEGGAVGTGRRAARPAGPHSPFCCGALSIPGQGISGVSGLPLARPAATLSGIVRAGSQLDFPSGFRARRSLSDGM